MTESHIRVGIISTDVRFRDRLREALSESGRGFRIALELSVRFADFGEEQVQALRNAAPDLLIVDLEDDPEVGVKLIQFLAESHPTHRVLAVGPNLSPGLLLAAMRAGVSDYLQKPVEPDALQESLQRVSALLGRAGESSRKPGQVFSIFGAKGGAGSTTLAMNLAIMLHRLTGKKTLLVDLDLRWARWRSCWAFQPRFNFVDMVQNFHRMDAGLLASFIERHSSGVHLLSAPYPPGAGRRRVGGADPQDPPVPAPALRLRAHRHVQVAPAFDAGCVRAVRRWSSWSPTRTCHRSGTSSAACP